MRAAPRACCEFSALSFKFSLCAVPMATFCVFVAILVPCTFKKILRAETVIRHEFRTHGEFYRSRCQSDDFILKFNTRKQKSEKKYPPTHLNKILGTVCVRACVCVVVWEGCGEYHPTKIRGGGEGMS
jgi:hypothetical protein